ncbi:unnamed protein product [Malus baccata var. baccata]
MAVLDRAGHVEAVEHQVELRLSSSSEAVEPRAVRTLPSSLTEIFPSPLESKLLKTFRTSSVTGGLGSVTAGLGSVEAGAQLVAMVVVVFW